MHHVVNLQLLGWVPESLQPIAMAVDSHRAGSTACKSTLVRWDHCVLDCWVLPVAFLFGDG